MLSIGTFAKLGQTSIKTLRFYDEIGLLRPAHVNRFNRYRYYSANQLSELRSIIAYKDMGFSLTEIRTLLSDGRPGGEVLDTLIEKRGALVTSLDEVGQQIRRIDEAIKEVKDGAAKPRAELSLKRTQTQWVAAIRENLATYDAVQSLLDEVGRFVRRKGAGGTTGAIWHNCGNGGDAVDCEAIVFLSKAMTGDERVRVYELPAATVACSIHQGNEDVSISYVNANRWIAANQFRHIGPNREVYLHGGYSDSESAIMEIQFPVEQCPPARTMSASIDRQI
ncbi:MAG TPA: MerR family transcriptional regulator [Blastocatellia bacterium]|nr:MerR family transcriptional regulator [Blastocatellia bacterium]